MRCPWCSEPAPLLFTAEWKTSWRRVVCCPECARCSVIGGRRAVAYFVLVLWCLGAAGSLVAMRTLPVHPLLIMPVIWILAAAAFVLGRVLFGRLDPIEEPEANGEQRDHPA